MEKIALTDLQDNVFELIGKEWMLVTAGTTTDFNMLTASWGGLGFLWNKPVAFLFIRVNRHTRSYIEAHDFVTLSFFGTAPEARKMLNFCGTKSGRDCNKAEACGLTPVATENGSVTFAQARLTLEGRKIYRTLLSEAEFLDPAIHAKWYNDRPGGELHYVYVVELTGAYRP